MSREWEPVVIDTEDRRQMERLARAWESQTHASLCEQSMSLGAYRMQAALRSLIAPPKPDEPSGRYAVVEDSEAVEWVRAELIGVAQWHSIRRELSRWADWDDIDAVKVLAEGVTP